MGGICPSKDETVSQPAAPPATIEFAGRPPRTGCNTAVMDETPIGFTGPVAGGMNEILIHLWPRISAYASEAIVNEAYTEIQPALLAALPSALQGIRFDQERCHLGDNPLEFRTIYICKETQQTARGVRENLVFQARVEWFSDLSVYLSLAGAGLGIQGLSFKGVLMLKLVGLMDRPPFFEGVRVYFNNLPEIDLIFQGAARGLLNLGLIRHKLLDLIREQLSDLMVVPNRLGYSIAPGTDIFEIKSPPAQGVLKLTVWSAKDILAMDKNLIGPDSSDPYVKIACGAYRFRSPTRFSTLAPMFAWSCLMPIADEAHQRLHLELFDQDMMSQDDFLGKLSLPTSLLIGWSAKKKTTCSLLDEHGHKGKNGTIVMSAEWMPLVLSATGENCAKAGLVFAGVYSASQLPDKGERAQYWVSVHCSGVLPDFDKRPRETDKCERCPDSVVAFDAHSDEMPLASKLALLRRHGMCEADIASVLGIQEETLRSLDTSARVTLERWCTVNWDRSFEFLVANAKESNLSFKLWCQPVSAAPELLGNYMCSIADLSSSPSWTSWRTVTVPTTGISLKLKLQMRHFGDHADKAQIAKRMGGG